MKPLTPKQQITARAKAFKLLAAIGFQHEPNGDYWWKQTVDSSTKRICVAFDIPDQCLGGNTDWVWQTAELDRPPAFGYSGSTSVGAQWANAQRVLDITLEQFHYAGISRGLESGRASTKELKTQISAAVTKLSEYV